MTDPVVLLGTQSNGETLPVQVNEFGQLVAEGLPGPDGPPGPPGPPGEIDLPPDPQDGQLLGWEDGQLAWVDPSPGGGPFEVDFLLVAGGGESGMIDQGGTVGGGAGGVINSIVDEPSGGGTTGVGARLFIPDQDYAISVGGVAEDTSIVGVTINEVAIAGGAGMSGSGGSGGGGVYYRVDSRVKEAVEAMGAGIFNLRGTGGTATPGQGFPGGAGSIFSGVNCYKANFKCQEPYCKPNVNSGGGGGSASAGVQFTGGEAIQSSITGTLTYYGAGGQSNNGCTLATGAYPLGRGSKGSGGGWQDTAQPGILILRTPKDRTLVEVSGNLSFNTTEVGEYKIHQFLNGQGVVQFS